MHLELANITALCKAIGGSLFGIELIEGFPCFRRLVFFLTVQMILWTVIIDLIDG